MNITRSIQIPNTPMFNNGVMDQAWYMFFYALSQNASKGEEIDTSQLLQLSSQLPAVTISNGILTDIDDLQRNFPISPILQNEDIQPMPPASVFYFEQETIFPTSSICCDDKISPLPTVQITNDMQVIINGND
ncbi:TPA: hypothetical protein ACRREX_000091 [Acinetobacter baumannii]|uniref:hypothetical protein n=1 Tax=Acinetobacter baumannii TaxID=470 RepID=UPI001128C1B6|nr:hypothetical protein [Acinetobacter baumannii]MCM1587099.1 hypothetical protein [Acinetobacter baumannii]TPU58101.1 hypothetical protein FJV29_07100 [Acinetobacter baumannii]HAV5681902.1 hypothetical protein [Acinetobacter baumannii]HCW5891552.1 hypothetical protein [Acinetobacter baumannii]HCW5902991.1 hypothetical protein [Acinetobacter baumannii]